MENKNADNNTGIILISLCDNVGLVRDSGAERAGELLRVSDLCAHVSGLLENLDFLNHAVAIEPLSR
jgi:hypothetical protein